MTDGDGHKLADRKPRRPRTAVDGDTDAVGESPRPRRGRPRKERTTKLVVASAVELLLERGYGAVSIEAVAERAGVTKPTIYLRWSNRYELLLDAYRAVITDLDPPDLGDLRKELRWLLTARAKIYAAPGADKVLAGLASAATEDEGFRVAAAESTARLMAPSRTILKRGVARGDVRPDIDIDAAATLIASPMVYRRIFEMAETSSKQIDEFCDLLIRALLK
ncbi:TetR/AcrR family transcriptional regulator [Mycolicibacterium wolinskyi]|uniref:TetR/AcrR family transcriptional regulator n=1 Tax=Mycolicibacterium wolinskyi TaxID=59750 RepID=UPI0039176A7C